MVKKSENNKRSIEVEGATVEEAVQKALKLLHALRDDVVVKTVCEEQKGLFGMSGAKPAKVKVSLKEENT